MGRSGRHARTVLKAALSLPELGARRRPGPRILIYHQIGTDLGREMEVESETFAEQIQYLEHEGSIVSLEKAIAGMGVADDDRLFVLTFDDGYADMYRNAFPLLAERGHPFTLYLSTLPIEEPAMARPGAEAASWGEVEEMVETGLATIGAHTHSHPDLRTVSRTLVAFELDTSNGLIEEHLGIRPRHFAYPYGWWSADAEAEVRDRYATAVLGEGRPNTRDTHPLRINRIAVQKSDGMRFFKRKLDTGLVWEDRLRRAVRRYDGPPEAG